MSLKDTYIEKLKIQLDEWSADIDALEAKGRQVDADLKARYHDKIEELKYQKTLAQGRIRELQESAEEAWEDIRNGSESIWTSVKQTFADAKSKFDK